MLILLSIMTIIVTNESIIDMTLYTLVSSFFGAVIFVSNSADDLLYPLWLTEFGVPVYAQSNNFRS